MNRRQLMALALQCRAPRGQVPLWELHFHLWPTFTKERFITGAEFMRLSAGQRALALERNADIMASVADMLGMAAVSIPDAPWDCVYTLPQPDRLALVELLRRRNPDFLIVAGCSGNISMPSSSDGYVNFCYQLMDEPERIEELCERTFQNACQLLDSLTDAGVDAVYNAADMADNRGPFFSPPQMERFIWPYMERWNQRVRQKGLFSILHTDGNVEKLLPGYMASGVQALQALDPISGMSLSACRAAVGQRLALCGNLDCALMVAGRPEQIDQRTLQLLSEDGLSGGMVLGCSNAVVSETPKANYEAMIQAHRDWIMRSN